MNVKCISLILSLYSQMSFGHEYPLDSARRVTIFIGWLIQVRALFILNQIANS